VNPLEHAKFTGQETQLIGRAIDDQGNHGHLPPRVGNAHSPGNDVPMVAQNLFDFGSLGLAVFDEDANHPEASIHRFSFHKKTQIPQRNLGFHRSGFPHPCKILRPTHFPLEVSHRLPRRVKKAKMKILIPNSHWLKYFTIDSLFCRRISQPLQLSIRFQIGKSTRNVLP